MSESSNIIPIPVAPAPESGKKSKKGKYGKWGDRDREHPRSTMSDGRKRVRATIGTKPDGSPEIRSFTGRTIAEAYAKRDEYLDRLAAEKNAPPPPPPIPPEIDPAQTVAKWASRWYLTYSHGSEITQGIDDTIVNKISESSLGSLSVESVQPLHVQVFANSCAHFSFSYVKKIKSVVVSVFETAVENGLISTSPCVKTRWDHAGAGERPALDDADRALIAENWHLCPAGVGAMLMLFSGMRPEEARALNWNNVLDDSIAIRDSSYFNKSGQMILKLGVTKTESGQRDVPMAPQLKDMFDYLGRKPDQLVWLSSQGEMLSGSSYRRNWDTFLNTLCCIRLGIKKNKNGDYAGFRSDRLPEEDRAIWVETHKALDFTPYYLRHTFCTMMFEAGLDLKTIQYLMGHNDIETTMKHYLHWSEAQKTHSYKKYEKFFAKKYCFPHTSGTKSGT